MAGRVAFAEPDPDRGAARTVVRCGSELIGSGGGHPDEYVIGFRDGNQKTAYFHRFHLLAVRGDDGHRPAGEFQVEIGGGRSVNDS